MISIDDFKKIDIVVGKILSAENIMSLGYKDDSRA